jgi:hypothetical protein
VSDPGEMVDGEGYVDTGRGGSVKAPRNHFAQIESAPVKPSDTYGKAQFRGEDFQRGTLQQGRDKVERPGGDDFVLPDPLEVNDLIVNDTAQFFGTAEFNGDLFASYIECVGDILGANGTFSSADIAGYDVGPTFDAILDRLDDIETDIGAYTGVVSSTFDAILDRLDDIETDIGAYTGVVSSTFDAILDRLDAIEAALANTETIDVCGLGPTTFVVAA